LKKRTSALALVVLAIVVTTAVGVYYVGTQSYNAADSWTITNIVKATNTTSLHQSSTTYDPGFDYTTNESYSFLLVSFDIRMGDKAEPLNATDIIVLVDGTQKFQPCGLSIGLDSYVGDFSGTLNGTNYNEAEFTTINSSGYRMDSYPAGPPYTFVYILPSICIDGGHSFQLKIAGSAEGRAFMINP
jgi:hypothetical protein